MFRRIYVEKALEDHSYVKDLLAKRRDSAPSVIISHYKDVFSRERQEYHLQKESPSLILAPKRPPFLYKGSKRCKAVTDTNGVQRNFYALPLMNCPMNCEYCFLRGMYPTGNIVFFVNFKEMFAGLKHEIDEYEAHFVALSYESDLIFLDPVLHCLDPWLDFVSECPSTLFELRTKAGILGSLSNRPPLKNLILSWTITPNAIQKAFERGAPPLKARLNAAKRAIEMGWRVRLCIDPILYVDAWDRHYRACIDDAFSLLDPKGVEEVQVGIFRMAKGHLKKARHRFPTSVLLHYPYELIDDTFSYPEAITSKLIEEVRKMLSHYVDKKKIKIVGMQE